MIRVGGLVLVSALTVSSAYAADWSVNVSLSDEIKFQNNPTLSTTDKEDNAINTLTPSISGVYETGELTADFSLSADVVHATNKDVQNNYVGYETAVETDYSYEKGLLEFDYSLSVDSVLNTEFDDTNIYSSDVTRTSNEFAASVKHDLTNYSKLTFSQTYDNMDYDGGSYTPYENMSSKLGLSTDLSETVVFSPTLGFDLYSPKNSSSSKTYRLDLGTSYTLSETSSLESKLGVRRNNQETGWTQSLDYTAQWEQLGLNFGTSYDQSPSGTGSLRKSLKFNLGGSYALAEDWTANFSTNYSDSKQSGSNSGGSSYNVSFSPSVSYVINEAWTTSLTYNERRRKASGSDTWAVSREGMYVLNYNFQYR